MKKLFLISVFIINHFFYLQTVAQDYWITTNGPNGGKIGDIGINSRNELFSGGWWESSGIYRSTNGGSNWEKINNGFRNFEVYSIGIGKNDDIFLGTNQQGIFRSTDNGETWQKKDNGYNTAECWTIAFNDTGEVFAGGGDWGGVYKSTNNGESWTRLTTLQSIILAVNKNGDLYNGNWQGLYKSTDDGNTWNQLTNGLPNIPIACIEYNSTGGIYVGTGYYSNGDGVYYSGDNGSSWTRIGLADTIVQSILIKDDYKIYAGTLDNGVLLSTDQGNSWNQMNNGLFDFNVFRLKMNNDGELFTGSETDGGIYKSTDDGVSWKQIGLPTSTVQSIDSNNKDGFIFTASLQGVHRFNLSNNNWENLGLGPEITCVAVKNDSILFAGSFRNGLYRSFDNGNTWEPTTMTADSSIYIYNLFVKEEGAIILLTSNYARISYDDGITWQIWNNGFSYPSVRGIAINPMGDIFISSSSKVYRSTDGGVSFQVLNTFDDIRNNGIAVNNHLGVFVNDAIGGIPGGGIYRSLDNGNSWEKVRNLSAYSIMVVNDQSIFSSVHFGPYNTGILNSKDDGSTWQEISSGLDQEKKIISFHQNKEGYIFAGSYGGGLYRSSNPVTNVKEDPPNFSVKYSLLQNYPNPFNPTTSIQYAISSRQYVTLKVFDILGSEVATLVNEEKPAGSYEVEFNPASSIKNPASGIYFYQLKAGDFVETKKMILLR